jgi:acetyl-CoA carboxylase biotin carboxyl carrier protein
MVDLKRVEELIELMRRSGVVQLSLELPEYKISITRGAEEAVGNVSIEPVREVQPLVQEEPPVAEAPTAALPVVSPVVGIFHNGGMFDPREIVREGDRVREGQLLAAIEAMKVPNELRAPVGGVVSRLLVEDGAPVEFGQRLFLIEPEEGGEASDSEPQVGLA